MAYIKHVCSWTALLSCSTLLSGCLTLSIFSERPTTLPTHKVRIAGDYVWTHDPTTTENNYGGSSGYKGSSLALPYISYGLSERIEVSGSAFLTFTSFGYLAGQAKYRWLEGKPWTMTTNLGVWAGFSGGSSSSSDTETVTELKKSSTGTSGVSLSQSFGIQTERILYYFGPKLCQYSIQSSYRIPGRTSQDTDKLSATGLGYGVFAGTTFRLSSETEGEKAQWYLDVMGQLNSIPQNLRGDRMLGPAALVGLIYETR